jgi:hypothetical protein
VLDARLTTLLCKKIVTKCNEIETRVILAESSKQGCGLRSAVLPVMMMMMMIYYKKRQKIKALP